MVRGQHAEVISLDYVTARDQTQIVKLGGNLSTDPSYSYSFFSWVSFPVFVCVVSWLVDWLVGWLTFLIDLRMLA